MKKIATIIAGMMILTACSNNGGESGAVDDGFKGGADTNGGLPNVKTMPGTTQTDTALDEHRVDTWKRDSTNKQP